MLDKLTKESFSPHVDTTFVLTYEESGQSNTLDVKLIEVEGYGMPPAPSRKWGVWIPTREAFSLIFQGPYDKSLPQKMYPMQHDKMGALDPIFIVPVAKDNNGYYYQAIFT